MKRFISSLALIMTVITLTAGNIKGRVVESGDDKAPLGQCTVKLLSERDSSFVKGTASDNNGTFSFSGVNNGRYIVQFTYIGYEPVNQSVRVTPRRTEINMGDVVMKESGVLLKETVVLGAKTEITVKEDTVEYNADAYRTQPNAVVEDLLKRLPGVEVDSEGKITANGKEVTKILVDGKEFFADDPKVASKNLPVEMVEKLQVVDRKSDLARMTGVDDGEEETVINLTVKKGMNNGWFGNVEAGYGTDDRYAVNAIVNRFWDGNQFTIIGNANNTNNLGFTDGNSGRFRRFGGANGINSTQSLGFNFNVGKEEIFRAGGNVLYSHSDNDSRQKIDREYLFTDSSSYYYADKLSRDKGHNIRADFRIKWEIDSFNAIEFRPNLSYNINDSYSLEESQTFAGDALRSQVNNSRTENNSEGESFEFGGDFVYNHKFHSRKGRALSFNVRYRLSNVNEDESAYTKNTFFLVDDEDLTNQIIDNHTWSNQVNSRITWTEPLGDVKNARFIEIAYHLNYRWNNADKLVYDRPLTDASQDTETQINRMLFADAVASDLARVWGPALLLDADLAAQIAEDVLNEDLSNRFRNDFFDQRLQLGYKQVREKYNLNLGVVVSPTMSKSENLINDAKSIPTRWVWNVAPYLRFRYKFSKSSSLAADYRARSSQPSMSQLQPVADESNPLRIVIGNPNLKPTFTNNINVRYHNFNQEHQRSIMAMVRAQFATNSIISATKYNSETGGQTTTYENVNGVWNIMGMNMINFPLRNKHWQFSNHFFARYSVSKGYINTDFNTSKTFSFNESVGITYRNDFLEVQLRPNYSLQTTDNTVTNSSNNSVVHTYGGMLYANVTLPFGLGLNSDLNYSARSGYSEGFNTNTWLWNMSLSYQFLKGKEATIAIKAYDLLRQKQNLQRSITAGYIQDQEYNNLTRYFMVTLSYRFNTFGNGKTPEGFRGGRRMGPMGPPPRR